jgi:two-component system response regulator GlrR
VGDSVAMRALFAQLDRLAQCPATVRNLGESGTAKELYAGAIHERGARARKPFLVIDCGAIPPELVESELFGHERGAFTGASQERKGAFEAADGGTLLLDEIGELPLNVQPKLLRALERRQVKRVGADQHRSVDVRFVAATHRDLRRAVNQGTFREDLFFRLAVAMVRVPPLRERTEDLPMLLEYLWGETFRALGLEPRPFTAPSAETLRHLSSLPWEGNVRELRNFVERSVALSGALDTSKLGVGGSGARSESVAVRHDLPYRDAKEAWLEIFEKAYLSRRLEQASGNVSQVAREADMDRAHLIKLLKKYAVR